jgi:conjugative transposon TraN protein
MKSIYRSDKRKIRHIGYKCFGIELLLKSIYACNDFLYFHIQIKNASQTPFDIDFIRIKIADKKTAKRTAIQEQLIQPVRAYRYNIRIAGKKTERMVFALQKFTIPGEKQLSDREITDLLTKGKTGIIKGFKSKAGKIFDAALKFDENYKIVFDFTENKDIKRGK